MERVHRIELQYDGTGLHGWAKQKELPTVEGSLEEAFRTVLGHAPSLRVAGRTDSGVHARRQVVSLSLPAGLDLGKLTYSLNSLTPPGIAITRIVRARPGFDARTDAVSRRYRYYLSTLSAAPPFWRQFCWDLPGKLDLALLRAAAGATCGHHDFTAFTPAVTEHVFFKRTVFTCAWRSARADLVAGVRGPSNGAVGTKRYEGMLYLEIEADAFLRHMVRSLVGTMVEVARGQRTIEDFVRLLEGCPREEAGLTAPAHGLFLWDVKYAPRRSAGEPPAARRRPSISPPAPGRNWAPGPGTWE